VRRASANVKTVSALIFDNLLSRCRRGFQYDIALSRRSTVLERRIEEVTKANQKFYEAFESLDIAKMDEVWAHLDYVTCVHPGWTLRSDWPAVRDSWVLIFNNTFSMKFALTDSIVQVAGDMAWVICVENITSQQSDEPQQARVLATNLFERIGDEWLMIHHHGSAVMG
jgi:ketosteroid isomerase-like protein